jgi:hypothetical protein
VNGDEPFAGIKKPRIAGFFYAFPTHAGKEATNYLAADASAAGAAADASAAGAAAGADASTAGAATGAAASSFLPQAARAAAAITAAKTIDLFMMIFLI